MFCHKPSCFVRIDTDFVQNRFIQKVRTNSLFVISKKVNTDNFKIRLSPDHLMTDLMQLFSLVKSDQPSYSNDCQNLKDKYPNFEVG